MARPGFAYRLLVVDDDPLFLRASRLILEDKGYEVRTAADGFEALVELRRSMPDVIISDLRMPNMSGFELLSVVRRRFPHIPVIAISGEFSGRSPAGLIADAFFTKGQYAPEELFQKIAELMEQSPLRPNLAKPDRSPVWIPCVDTGYFVVTCTDCLRSFPVPDESLDGGFEVRSSTCTFCGTTVRYLAGCSHGYSEKALERAEHLFKPGPKIQSQMVKAKRQAVRSPRQARLQTLTHDTVAQGSGHSSRLIAHIPAN